MYATLLGILVTLASAPAHAGGRSDGGADPRKMDAAYVRLLLEDGSLKRAMLNYLHTLSVDDVKDEAVRSTLARAMAKDAHQLEALRKDIETTGNYVIQPRCTDVADSNVAASARIGDLGGPICFDVDRLGENYHELSREEGMIRLAALAFHEHVHHFQNPNASIDDNEREAYRVGAYVELTAKVVQEPVLKWDPNHTSRRNRGPDEDEVQIDLPEVKTVTCRGVEVLDAGIAVERTVKVRVGKGETSWGRRYDALTDVENQGHLITDVTRDGNDYTFAFANIGKFFLELHPGYAGATACQGDHWVGIEKWVPPLSRRPVNAPRCNDHGMARFYNGDRWVGMLTITDAYNGSHGGPMICSVEF